METWLQINASAALCLLDVTGFAIQLYKGDNVSLFCLQMVPLPPSGQKTKNKKSKQMQF